MECCTEHSFLRAKMSLAIKKKMRKSGSKVTKRIDVTKMACEEKLERFQSTAQAIDLAQDWIQFLVTDIPITIKIGAYHVCVLRVLLYGCETRTTYRRHIKYMEPFHQRCLRLIMKISWLTYTPDTVVLRRTGFTNIESIIRKHSFRWCRHVARFA